MSLIDLETAARRAMVASGFPVDFPAFDAPPLPHPISGIASTRAGASDSGDVDLRHLIWSSIDNHESRDLDQVEVAEARPDGTARIMVGIADVDSLVPKDSPLDIAAAARTTSVYTGAGNFPMLPSTLSEDATSLLAAQDRAAVITELIVGPSGEVLGHDVYRARLRNRAKLTYEEIGKWLDNCGHLPPEAMSAPGLEIQLRIQDIVSAQLRAVRMAAGALDFDTIEARPIVENGRVVDLAIPSRGRARSLIENFMIAANTAVSAFLKERNFPSIQRIVRRPARWDRIVEIAHATGDTLPPTPDSVALSAFLNRRRAADPDHFADLSISVIKLIGPGEYEVVAPGQDLGEHFGLAVYGYTHSTAPNRRYVDLVTQRLLKAACANQPSPYTVDQLAVVATNANARAQSARKVERTMRKIIAASLMQPRIGQTFNAIVTGVKSGGTYVRLAQPPVEGRVMRGQHNMDVGDRVRVRLIGVDVDQGFIDFARV